MRFYAEKMEILRKRIKPEIKDILNKNGIDSLLNCEDYKLAEHVCRCLALKENGEKELKSKMEELIK